MIQTPDKETDHQREAVQNFVLVDSIDESVLADAMTRLQAEEPLTAAMSFYEPVLLPTAIVADRLGLHANPVTAVRTARNKILTRQALAAAGIPQMAWRECSRPEEAIEFLEALGGGPVILKPITGAGSAGVHLVSEPAGMHAAWAAQADLPGWAALDNPGAVMIAEQLLPGRELSVEAMSRDGRHEVVAVTEKSTTGPPHFVEIGHVQPAAIDDAEVAAVRSRVVAVLTAIGHEVGPSHTEVMLDGTDVWVVETHTRFGGDQIWELTQLTTGRHFATETLAALLDLPAPQPDERRGGAAVRFLTGGHPVPPPRSAIDDDDADATVLRIHRVSASPAGPLTDSSRRAGYVLAVANTPSAAAHAALTTARDIEVVPR